MGWDADAIYDGKAFGYVEPEHDQVAAAAFRRASEASREASGEVDACLENGGLGVSDCVQALAKYSGETDRAAVWGVARTRSMYDTIEWPDLATVPLRERWAIVSAQAFLRVCAEQGYGVQFDP